MNAKIIQNKKILVTAIPLFLLIWAFYYGYSLFIQPIYHYPPNSFIFGVYWFFAFLLIVSITAALYMTVSNVRIERVFLLTACAFGLTYVFLIPPQAAPDELYHIQTAYYYSNILLLQPSRVMREADVDLRDARVVFRRVYVDGGGIHAYRTMRNELIQSVGRVDTVAVPGMHIHTEPFYLYIFSAVGIALGRVMGLGSIPVLLLGSIFNLIAFMIPTYFAIKYIPFGKMVLFCIAMFPMTLHLAASFSPDSLINGLSFFLIAYVLYLAYEKDKVTLKDVIVLGIVSMLLAPSKGGAHLPLCFLVLMIPRVKFSGFKFAKYSHWLILGASFISFFALSIERIISSVGDAGYNIGWETYSLSFIFNEPIEFISIFLFTLVERLDIWLYWAIGSLLGGLDVPVRMILVIGFLILTLVSALKVDGQAEIFLKHMFVFVAVAVVSAGLSILAMFVAWTWAGSPRIEGVQGRYFLPVFPLLVLLLRNSVIVTKKNIEYGILICLCALQVLTVIDIFSFYMTQ